MCAVKFFTATSARAIAAAAVLSFSSLAQGQGTFQNLNFESAIPPFTPDINGRVPVSKALPGWTAYINGSPTDWVLYNTVYLGGPSLALTDSLAPYPDWLPIQGNYSVLLGPYSAAIGQIGQFPINAQSVSFLTPKNSYSSYTFLASFAGQPIPLVQFGTSGNNIVMAGDISMFAGQTGELRFLGTGLLDAVQFSSQPIPEPATISLFVLGLGVLILRWRKC